MKRSYFLYEKVTLFLNHDNFIRNIAAPLETRRCWGSFGNKHRSIVNRNSSSSEHDVASNIFQGLQNVKVDSLRFEEPFTTKIRDASETEVEHYVDQ